MSENMVVLKYGLMLFLLLFVRNSVLATKAIQDKMEIVSYNKDYLENPKFTMFNSDSSTDVKAFNMSFTLKQDLPNVVMIHVQVYRLIGSDYHVFPLNITTNICDRFKEDNAQLQAFMQHSNIKGCPLKKGSYYVRNFAPQPRNKIPPYIPTGSYMAESKTSVQNNVELFTTRFYARIV